MKGYALELGYEDIGPYTATINGYTYEYYLIYEGYWDDYDWNFIPVRLYAANIVGISPTPTVISIPSTLGGAPIRFIPINAFQDNKQLTSLTLPASPYLMLPETTLRGCSSLTDLTISSDFSLGFNYGFDEFILFKDCTALENVTFLNGVTTIWNKAFEGLYNLKSVTIPSSVTSIGFKVFTGCWSLESIALPSGVTKIEDYTFDGCSALTSINIPSSVTSIGVGAFNDCRRLASVTIPSSIKAIAARTFFGCSGLKSVTLSEGVTSIGMEAFYGCGGLTSIVIPSSVTSFGNYAFENCTGLQSVYMQGNAPSAPVNIYNGTPTTLTTYITRLATGWPIDPYVHLGPGIWCNRTIVIPDTGYTVTTEVPVPHPWLDEAYPSNTGNYEALATGLGLNGIPVWQSYVAGLVPTDTASKFLITNVVVKNGGGAKLDWTPHRSDRTYKVWGKTNLTDKTWHTPTNDATRFFKVSVDM